MICFGWLKLAIMIGIQCNMKLVAFIYLILYEVCACHTILQVFSLSDLTWFAVFLLFMFKTGTMLPSHNNVSTVGSYQLFPYVNVFCLLFKEDDI